MNQYRLGELRVNAGSDILAQAASSPHFYTLYEGWALRRVTLGDGRSQITNFALPGTLLGLQAALQMEMDHSVEALTDVVLCVFARSEFYRLFEKQADLSYRIVWEAAREENFLDANILSVGRKHATEKIAYLLSSLYERAANVGLVSRGKPLDIPISQQHVADSMGLSIAHSHRVLRNFAARKLILPNRKKIRVLDAESLAEIGHFNPQSVLPLALL